MEVTPIGLARRFIVLNVVHIVLILGQYNFENWQLINRGKMLAYYGIFLKKVAYHMSTA